MVPLKYGVAYEGSMFTALVSIFHADGTVAIAHGGIEIGQGINTKVGAVDITVKPRLPKEGAFP